MKRIFSIFLSFLALTAFGQINIRTGDPRTLLSATNGLTFNQTTGASGTDSSKIPLNITIGALRASTTLQTARTYHIVDTGRQGDFIYSAIGQSDNSGTALHDGNGATWLRQYSGPINVLWFGIIRDGITDNTSAVTAMTSYINGHDVYAPTGSYVINNMTWANAYNVNFYGAGRDSTIFICTTTDQIFGLTGARHLKMHGFKLVCTWTNLTLDFVHALIGSFGQISDDVEIYDFTTKNPNTNSDAVAFAVQTIPQGGTWGGSMRHIHIHDFIIDSCGQTAITILNRDSIGRAAVNAGTLSPQASGMDSAYDIRIERGVISNTGVVSGATFGIGLTLDGVGYYGYVGDLILSNLLNEGIENTGYASYTFNNIVAQKPVSGRNWESWAFGNFPSLNCTIENCRDIDTMNVGAGFSLAINLHIINCTFKSKNTTQFNNCTGLNASNSAFISQDANVAQIKSSPNLTATNNVFAECWFINSLYGSNSAAVTFDGKGCNQNTLRNCHFRKGTGGVNVIWKDTAGYQNIVQNFDLGAGVSNGFRRIVLGAGTRDTLVNDDDLDYPFFQFTATISQVDTVVFSSTMHKIFAVHDSASNSIFCMMLGGGSGVLVPSGSVMTLYSDSLNLRTLNTLPTGATLVTSPSSADNTTKVASMNAVQGAIAGTIASAKRKPTIASVAGSLTSIVADTMVYAKSGNALVFGGSFTCTGPASGTTATASITLPNPSVLVGGHALFGVGTFVMGTTTGTTTSILGTGTGGSATAQVTWISPGTSTVTIFYQGIYFQQ